MQVRLLRRSDLRPTRMIGVVGQKCNTSGYHLREALVKEKKSLHKSMNMLFQRLTLSTTFSNDAGQSMAKQTNRRSVSG